MDFFTVSSGFTPCWQRHHKLATTIHCQVILHFFFCHIDTQLLKVLEMLGTWIYNNYDLIFQTLKGERYRLSVVVEELKNASTTDYKTALVAFINCLIISAPRLPDRIRVRNEFIGKWLLTHSFELLIVKFHWWFFC